MTTAAWIERIGAKVAPAASETETVQLPGEPVALAFPEGAPGTTATLLGSCDTCPSPPELRRPDGSAYTFALSGLPAVWTLPPELWAVRSLAVRFDQPASEGYTVEVFAVRGYRG